MKPTQVSRARQLAVEGPITLYDLQVEFEVSRNTAHNIIMYLLIDHQIEKDQRTKSLSYMGPKQVWAYRLTGKGLKKTTGRIQKQEQGAAI